ncbi:MAG: alanine racemase [Candidatus Riflebacteria bacterium]|nr:alanine racemase [Candidatus Riflebacteria bacterium]
MQPYFTDLETPVLLIDNHILNANLERGQSMAKAHVHALRPHIKTHKCPALADRQRALGATGFTVATIDEAESFMDAGFNDLFLAYPIVGAVKIRRALALAERGRMILAADHQDQLRELSDAARATDKTIEVRLEVDCGHHRCGQLPGSDLVTLARALISLGGLRLGGVYTHAGHAYGAATAEEIVHIGGREGRAVVDATNLLRDIGLQSEAVSAGSTPTLPHCAAIPGVNELRPGNYVFNDAIQVALGVAGIQECALSVLTTVVSVFDDRFIIDAGSKAVGLDKGAHGLEKTHNYGIFLDNGANWELARLSEEHGIVTIAPGGRRPDVGERLRFVPNHACAAVNLHRHLFVVEAGKIISEWSTAGRR